MGSDVNLQRTVAVETFTTVATSVLVVVPVTMATRDAITASAHCQQAHLPLLCYIDR